MREVRIVLPDGTERRVEGPVRLERALAHLGYNPEASPVVAWADGPGPLSPDDWLMPGDRVVLDWKVRGG